MLNLCESQHGVTLITPSFYQHCKFRLLRTIMSSQYSKNKCGLLYIYRKGKKSSLCSRRKELACHEFGCETQVVICIFYYLLLLGSGTECFAATHAFKKKMFCGHRGQILQKSLARGNPTPFFGNASILGTFGHTLVILAVTHAKKINFSSFRVSSADNSS